jgi:hypothetical protein
MAISQVCKNFRDGTILIEDGTGTPIALTVQFENGDFSISGLNQGNYEVNTYLDRGELGCLRLTNRSFPTGSFSAHFTDLSDATEKTLFNAATKTGAFASAVSTRGANSDVMTYDITFTVEGTDFGDAADHVLTLADVRIDSWDFAEGDPDTQTINFTVYGAVSGT